MKILDNKVSIVTGGGSGIGRAICKLFAAEGAKVVVSDIDEVGGGETVKAITEMGGEAFFMKSDTSKPADHQILVDETVKRYGGLHISVNNTGIGGPQVPTGEYPIEGWDHVIAVNLSGVFYGMRYQIPAMLKSGGGSIINMASILGIVGFANASAYAAAKHGVLGLTKNAAIEYASKNIRVMTPLLENHLDEAGLKYVSSLHPIGRLGKSEEVAELTLWLASDKASFVTGSYYTIDGGYTAQ